MGAMPIVVIEGSPPPDIILETDNSMFKIRVGVNPCIQHSNAYILPIIALLIGPPGIDNFPYSVHVILFFY